jgi:hypothetical protein
MDNGIDFFSATCLNWQPLLCPWSVLSREDTDHGQATFAAGGDLALAFVCAL